MEETLNTEWSVARSHDVRSADLGLYKEHIARFTCALNALEINAETCADDLDLIGRQYYGGVCQFTNKDSLVPDDIITPNMFGVISGFRLLRPSLASRYEELKTMSFQTSLTKESLMTNTDPLGTLTPSGRVGVWRDDKDNHYLIAQTDLGLAGRAIYRDVIDHKPSVAEFTNKYNEYMQSSRDNNHRLLWNVAAKLNLIPLLPIGKATVKNNVTTIKPDFEAVYNLLDEQTFYNHTVPLHLIHESTVFFYNSRGDGFIVSTDKFKTSWLPLSYGLDKKPAYKTDDSFWEWSTEQKSVFQRHVVNTVDLIKIMPVVVRLG
jgi:hypothetical protein